jgi:hypothetical protein
VTSELDELSFLSPNRNPNANPCVGIDFVLQISCRLTYRPSLLQRVG